MAGYLGEHLKFSIIPNRIGNGSDDSAQEVILSSRIEFDVSFLLIADWLQRHYMNCLFQFKEK